MRFWYDKSESRKKTFGRIYGWAAEYKVEGTEGLLTTTISLKT
jgi:hypothetical protein